MKVILFFVFNIDIILRLMMYLKVRSFLLFYLIKILDFKSFEKNLIIDILLFLKLFFLI